MYTNQSVDELGSRCMEEYQLVAYFQALQHWRLNIGRNNILTNDKQ